MVSKLPEDGMELLPYIVEIKDYTMSIVYVHLVGLLKK